MVEINEFPVIEGSALSGKKIKFPDDLNGDINLVGIAFVRDAQEMLESWYYAFEEEFKEDSDYQLYEIPMIDNKFWNLFSRFIDKGMRKGIPEEKHDYVVTYYGSTDEICKKLKIEDKSKAHLFLLDKLNNVKWKGQGFSTEEEENEMLEIAYNLNK